MPEPDTQTIDTPAGLLAEQLRDLPEVVPLRQAGKLLRLSKNTTYRTARRRRELELAGQPIDPRRDPEVFPLPVIYIAGRTLPRGYCRKVDILRHLSYLTAGCGQ